jgi:hypothetical protein
MYVPADEGEGVTWKQKGLREHLLCRPCEEKLSKHEDYAKKLLFGGDVPIRNGINTPLYAVSENVDYAAFKLFQMSILWRAGVASSPFFSQVRLGPHQENLRRMIQMGNPGKAHEYGCALMAVIDKQETIDLIRSPDEIDMDGYQCFRFLMGGFLWLYVIAGDVGNHDIARLFLQEDGGLTFLKSDPRDLQFIKGDISAMAARLDDVLDLVTKRGKHGSQRT